MTDGHVLKRFDNVLLLELDKPSEFTGNIYTSEAMAAAIKDYNKRPEGRMGELRSPHYFRRLKPEQYLQIDVGNSAIRTSNLRILLCGLVGDIEIINTLRGRMLNQHTPNVWPEYARPSTPGRVSFSMRSVVRYKDGERIHTAERTVENCNIVAFDAIYE